MKVSILLGVVSLLASCAKSVDPMVTDDWEQGLFTARLDVEPEKKFYGIVEIVDVMDGGARVRIYGNVFDTRPSDAGRADLDFSPSSEVAGWGGQEVEMRDDLLSGMKLQEL